MRLRSITLDNVRRFIDPVTVGPIGDGVTLLCEPNEAGKSTLFDALHALFFVKHGSQAADVKALRPHSGGRVAVECSLEHEGATWRIRKEWLSGASAKVWRDGTLAHQGDAAEDWLAGLVAGEAGGPGGLLWVRQGRVSLKAPEKKDEAAELEKRRDLLTVISGAMEQVTGGERMDQARDHVGTHLARLQTSTGRSKVGGRWAEAESAVEKLAAEEAELARMVEDLRRDLDERRRLHGDLVRLEDPEADEKRLVALEEAEKALREAEGLAMELAAAETRAKLARQTAESAKSEAARIARLRSEAREASEAHDTTLKAKVDCGARAVEAAGVHNAAKGAVTAAKDAQGDAEATLRRIDAREAAARAGAERARLAEQIRLAEAADAERIAQRALAKKGPDDKTVARIEGLVHDLATKQAVRDAAAPSVSARYQPGANQVVLGGKPLAEGETRALPEDGRIEMPGIGLLHIRATDEKAGAQLAGAENALGKALAAGGWKDLTALRDAARARAAAERTADLAEKTRDTIAPDGIELLRESLAALGEEAPGDDEDLPERKGAEKALREAGEDLSKAQADEARAAEKAQAAALAAAKAETAETGARERKAKAAENIRDLPDVDPAEEQERLASLETAAQAAEAAHAERAAQTPDLNHLRSHHGRVNAVVAAAAADAGRIRIEIGKLDGRIETRGEAGVEEALEEERGRLSAAHDTLERVLFEKDMLVRLRTALDAAQKAARETYFAPVAEELRPLLADLWDDAELQWSDETLLPSALVRKGTEEAVDVLSGGTQEQIAFLVRLAFARLLAKSGRHAPLILDDALVYSDDDRIEKMFDALHGAASDLQVIVLSCRQRAFRELGAPSLSFQRVEAS